MKCQRCNKNEANTHITKIINGVKTEMYLCSQCAGESNEMSDFGFGFDKEFENFFSGFFGGTQLNAASGRQMPAQKNCPLCKTSLDEILKSGKLGCSECYKTYSEYLIRPLKQIHGADGHTGKIPARCGKGIKRMAQIDTLQSELNQAVMEQNFEKAAELRDKINELKSQSE